MKILYFDEKKNARDLQDAAARYRKWKEEEKAFDVFKLEDSIFRYTLVRIFKERIING